MRPSKISPARVVKIKRLSFCPRKRSIWVAVAKAAAAVAVADVKTLIAPSGFKTQFLLYISSRKRKLPERDLPDKHLFFL